MNQYFIGRTSKNLADLIKSNYKDATTYAYFVDEKIDDAGIFAVKKEIAALEGALQKLSEQEAKYSAELDEALKQYAELKEKAAGMDAAELMDARLAVREEKERSAVDRVKAAYGEKYDPMMMRDGKRDVANLLHEEAETRSIRERLFQKQHQQKQNKKKSRDSWER